MVGTETMEMNMAGVIMPEVKLTNTETAIYNMISSFVLKKCYPPTVREIAKSVGLKSTSSVYSHLLSLKRKGYISLGGPGEPRSIRVVGIECIDLRTHFRRSRRYVKGDTNDQTQGDPLWDRR